MSTELCESEYVEALVSDFGLNRSDSIGDLINALISDEETDDEGADDCED